MTAEDEHAYLYYRSPENLRNESFTHRMRGLDEDEVREYLDMLADQIAAGEWERTTLMAELERLRVVNEQLKEHSRITPSPVPESAPVDAQAAAVLGHAQEVADQLLDDASRRAQEIIEAAQRQGQEAVRQARITMHDRMQSMYDELDGQLRRVGEAIRPSAADRLQGVPGTSAPR